MILIVGGERVVLMIVTLTHCIADPTLLYPTLYPTLPYSYSTLPYVTLLYPNLPYFNLPHFNPPPHPFTLSTLTLPILLYPTYSPFTPSPQAERDDLEAATEAADALAREIEALASVRPTKLYARNNAVDAYNNNELEKLDEQLKEFRAKDAGRDSHLRQLKEGTKVVGDTT